MTIGAFRESWPVFDPAIRTIHDDLLDDASCVAGRAFRRVPLSLWHAARVARSVSGRFSRPEEKAVIRAGFIDSLTNPSERVQPLLAAPALIKEVPDRPYDQFIAAPIPAAGQFLFDLLSQIGW